jgi:hypothetical protein
MDVHGTGERAAGGGAALRLRLLHDTDDEVVPVSGARAFAARPAGHGVDAALAEHPVDHAGIVMAAYVARRARVGRAAIRCGWPPGPRLPAHLPQRSPESPDFLTDGRCGG